MDSFALTQVRNPNSAFKDFMSRNGGKADPEDKQCQKGFLKAAEVQWDDARL